MNYPEWIERIGRGWVGFEHDRLYRMAKDAWAMAYYRGTEEGCLNLAQFCAKYSDEPDLGAGI